MHEVKVYECKMRILSQTALLSHFSQVQDLNRIPKLESLFKYKYEIDPFFWAKIADGI